MGMLTIRESDGEFFFSAKKGGRVFLALHYRDFDRAVDLIMAAKPELKDWVFRPLAGEIPNTGLSLGVHALALREVTGEYIV